MRLVVDTGVFSAALSRRRRPEFENHVAQLAGNQLFLAASTIAELRYGALVAEWGTPRRDRLEEAIAITTVIPVSDAFLTRCADFDSSVAEQDIPSPAQHTRTTCGSQRVRSTSGRAWSQLTPSSRTFRISTSPTELRVARVASTDLIPTKISTEKSCGNRRNPAGLSGNRSLHNPC